MHAPTEPSDRDTLEQVRVNKAELLAMLDEKTG